ncbi:proton-coupled zinc antiporter SLC30A2 isoform X2 [Eupeodes corollae]|uniref:proton-coupled zinc antiporter SLC30A2 isoform X2 n=1 Tax=Eupeodes corollae TaxID=290404 RepID=UPI002491718A|nr:proton-coupled zinc antiporter SLC30A2 isoform X2 [Eupeodes corollae]
MDKKEDSPFVIDFKSTNYGTASNNNISSSNRGTCCSGVSSGSVATPGTPTTIYCLHGQEHIELRGHCHRQRSEGVDVKARKKLIIASILCVFFMVAEIIGGYLSNSLAIATDAAHLLTDFASFMISLFAIWIAGRPSTQRMSFGWYRAEVIGALASVVMIWFITAILVWLAIQRVIHGEFEVDAEIMLITSALAIIVNLIMGFQLQHSHSHGGGAVSSGAGHGQAHGGDTTKTKKPSLTEAAEVPSIRSIDSLPYPVAPPPTRIPTPGSSTTPSAILHNSENGLILAETNLSTNKKTYSYQNSDGHEHDIGLAAGPTNEVENINVRAALIHVVGDVLQSVGVFLAAVVIYFKPEWAIADPICTFVFSVIVLFTTFSIMKDALLVLMEGSPSYLHYTEVMELFLNIQGVERVHNLRIWALSINKIALSAHLAVAPGANAKKILQDATTAVHLKYNFFETTIQIEDFTPEMEDCQQCTVPVS